MRRALLLLVLFSVGLLAGCNAEQERPDLGVPYIGGTQGLAISFPEGLPPAEIYDDGQSVFSIGILLENVGESAIGPGTRNQYGHIEIVGINPRNYDVQGLGQANYNDLFVTFQEADVTLESARRAFDGGIVTGESSMVTFDSLSYNPDNTGNQQQTIRANVCYEYRTYTQGEICVKDNLLERAQDDSICTVSGSKSVSGSGGPIQVTSLTQNPAGQGKMQVVFTIENLGMGTVYAPYSLSQNPDLVCRNNAGANLERNVIYAEVSLGDRELTDYIVKCPLMGNTDAGFVRMQQGSTPSVTCTIENLDLGGGRIFTENLNVDLFYTYNQFIETPVLIRDTNVGMLEPGR